MKKSIIVNGKEHVITDIEAGIYEEFCEAKEKVNPCTDSTNGIIPMPKLQKPKNSTKSG